MHCDKASDLAQKIFSQGVTAANMNIFEISLKVEIIFCRKPVISLILPCKLLST